MHKNLYVSKAKRRMSRNEQRGCIVQIRAWRMSLKASEFRRLTAWWRVSARAPFHTTLHEMLEMRYLWQQPVRRENTQRVSFLGQELHTLLEDAVRAALWLPAARRPKAEAQSPKPKAYGRWRVCKPEPPAKTRCLSRALSAQRLASGGRVRPDRRRHRFSWRA